jgi:hypothetical protein
MMQTGRIQHGVKILAWRLQSPGGGIRGLQKVFDSFSKLFGDKGGRALLSARSSIG